MPPLRYHAGQVAIQNEAKTTRIAEKLAHWVGPVAEFCELADLFFFATPDRGNVLRFTVVSGAPPLVRIDDTPEGLRVVFPAGAAPRVEGATPAGGLAIRLEQARRARVNGTLIPMGDGRVELRAQETFTLCRKYMAPSASAAASKPHVGPAERLPLRPEDPWLVDLLAKAETAWLATRAPDGAPDVAHRGGPAGFLRYEPADGLEWTEYVGDGVFKSAGNLRATGAFTLLVVDLATGDGAELVGRAEYTNLRTDRRQEPLVQHPEPFPVQGTMKCRVESAQRLRGVWPPRKRVAANLRITSKHSPDVQAPQ